MKSMAAEYDTNEYLFTNDEKVFTGNAIELITAIYKAERLPIRVRLYAATKAVDYENVGGKSVEEIREELRRELEGDPEENERAIWGVIHEFVKFAINEAIPRARGLQSPGTPAWIVELVTEALAEQPAAPIKNIVLQT